jgi:hypothetical protein
MIRKAIDKDTMIVIIGDVESPASRIYGHIRGVGGGLEPGSRQRYHLQRPAVRSEHLDAMVPGIGHVDLSIRSRGKSEWVKKLSGAAALGAELQSESSFGVVDNHPMMDPIQNVDITLGPDSDIARHIEGVLFGPDKDLPVRHFDSPDSAVGTGPLLSHGESRRQTKYEQRHHDANAARPSQRLHCPSPRRSGSGIGAGRDQCHGFSSPA